MVDYSKWKNIEISDDEDDTHPNIDTPSLFRWRHKARVERMEDAKREHDELEKKQAEISAKQTEYKNKLKEASDAMQLKELKSTLDTLEADAKALAEKKQELDKKDQMAPWNVDTISQPGFAKTVINKKQPRKEEENLTDEEREKRMRKFFKENEKELKHFGLLRRYDDSRAYLKQHNHLVCENTVNYLVIWCRNLEMEEKHDLMEHVAHQSICMQYIMELAKQLDYDPRTCVDAFFTKIQVAEPLYKQSFEDELEQLKKRIRKRAAEKLEEAIQEAEEEERQQRLGPGGLDPIEVLESLPEDLKKCFATQDIQLLQETILKMDEADAKYHIKRCVDSGLWVPDGGNKQKEGGAGDDGEEVDDNNEQQVEEASAKQEEKND